MKLDLAAGWTPDQLKLSPGVIAGNRVGKAGSGSRRRFYRAATAAGG